MNSTECQLYPLELSLRRIKKVWGGWPGKIGEIWSLSGLPHESIVLNGALAGLSLTDIVGEFQQKLLGKGMELDLKEPFPMRLKFISAAVNLSIQVHPDDTYTTKNALPMVGKDKIWYILSVSPGGLIYLGFKEKTNKKKTKEAIDGKTLHHLMNAISVKPGELYTIPAGRIHSIGKGIKLFEIQRHSDLTFKLFDWNHKPRGGDAARFQIDEALNIIDFSPITPKSIPKITTFSEKNRIEYLALTPRFISRRLIIKDSLEISFSGDRFVVYTGLRGSGWLRWGFSDIYSYMQPYQSILVPGITEEHYFKSEDGLEMLETSVPDMAGETLDQFVRLGIPIDRIVKLGGEDYGKILKEYMTL